MTRVLAWWAAGVAGGVVAIAAGTGLVLSGSHGSATPLPAITLTGVPAAATGTATPSTAPTSTGSATSPTTSWTTAPVVPGTTSPGTSYTSRTPSPTGTGEQHGPGGPDGEHSNQVPVPQPSHVG